MCKHAIPRGILLSFCTCRLLVSCLAVSWLAPSCSCQDLCHCRVLFLVWLILFIWDHHTAFKNQTKPAVILGNNVWILKVSNIVVWETGKQDSVSWTIIVCTWYTNNDHLPLCTCVLSHRYTEISSGRCVARCACCWILVPDTVRSTGANGGAVMNVHFLNAVEHGERNCCRQ